MDNTLDFNISTVSSTNGKKGKTKYLKIALLLSQGIPISVVSKEVGISKSRLYHLVSDKESLVNLELNRLINDIRLTHQRLLVDLLCKTLQTLDEMLSSPNSKVRSQAVSLVLKVFEETIQNDLSRLLST